MIQRKDVMVLLSLVVIASGCGHVATNGSSSAAASSVSVQNFSAFPQENVYNNQQVRLTLTLINEGDMNAKKVQARLFNVPFETENGTNNNVWGLENSRSIDFGALQAADEENNLPAREKNRYWTLEAPSLSNGVTIPYNFMSRIYYKYSTRGTSSITLMNQQRFREQGGASRPTLETTDGPIQMEIRTRSPIVFYPGEESRQSEMCVIVTNKGEGTPFLHSEGYSDSSYNVPESATNKVLLTVPNQGGIKFSPSNPSGKSTDANTAVVEMFGNRGIKCFNINVDGWENNLAPQEEVPIVLEANYGYYKETSTSVTVQGSDRFSETSTNPDGETEKEGGAASTGPDDK